MLPRCRSSLEAGASFGRTIRGLPWRGVLPRLCVLPVGLRLPERLGLASDRVPGVLVLPRVARRPWVGVVPPRLNRVLPRGAVFPREPHVRIAQQSLHTPAHVARAHELGGTEWDGDGDERDVVLPRGKRVVVVLGLLHGGHGRRIRAHSLPSRSLTLFVLPMT